MKDRKERSENVQPTICDGDSHEWVVFSTALAEGGIVESCGQVKKGKRRRILLLEKFLSHPTTGQERIRHHASRYEERHGKSSIHEGTEFGFGWPDGRGMRAVRGWR